MGLIFGFIKWLLKYFIYVTIFAAVLVFIPNLPPYTKFSSIPLDPLQPRIGPLATNGALNKAERLYVDKVLGPEAFQVYKGELYTSLASGEIVKLNPGGHVTFVTKLGLPCTGLVQEPICGRPLGFVIDEAKDLMYIADAYYGIWKVNLKNDKKQLLVSPRVDIEGRRPKLFNFLALAQNGDLYWSDSTSDFNLQNGVLASFADPSGRLFQYNAVKNQSKVLLDDLWFANGVAISPDNQFVVVAETAKSRLLKYYIAGPKKGKSEVFVTGLPGVPDNLRVLPDGSGLLVPLYLSFDEDEPFLLRSLSETPLVRKLLARLVRLIEIPIEYINNVYPHVVLEEIIAYVGNFRSLEKLSPHKSGLLVVNWNGNVIESYFNTDGTLPTLSDAIVWNNKLVTGGPHQNYIGSVPVPQLLKKAFDSKVASASKPKPAEAKSVPSQEKPVPKAEPAKPVESPKPAAAKPVEQPKPAAAKPTENPKPSAAKPAAAKPVEQPKPAAAKPVEQLKPAAAKPVEQPKPAAAKPVEQLKPAAAKPVEQPKPAAAKSVEQPKPAAAKPVEQPKPAAGKPVEQPKPSKPVEQPKPVEQKKQAQQKPVKSEPAKPPKQEAKAPKKSAESNKAKAEPEPEFIVTRPKEEAKEAMKNKLAPENIPIKEEIPSDTAKPTKEKLKVIKKGGPAEIPNPHL